jgi:hypothetical protein
VIRGDWRAATGSPKVRGLQGLRGICSGSAVGALARRQGGGHWFEPSIAHRKACICRPFVFVIRDHFDPPSIGGSRLVRPPWLAWHGRESAVGDYVHEPGLGFRFPSLSLNPSSEGRYDYIALVPLDFRRKERHARASTPKLSRHSASRTSTSRSFKPRDPPMSSAGWAGLPGRAPSSTDWRPTLTIPAHPGRMLFVNIPVSTTTAAVGTQ